MSKLDATDIQGFVLRGYALPFARYMFLEILDSDRGRKFIDSLLGQITTGEHWDAGKPEWTLNIAFTHKGLVNLSLPDPSLLSFPVEFIQGMKARKEILADTGKNDPQNWDTVWREGKVDIWLAVNSKTKETLESCCAELERRMSESGGARLLDKQDAGALLIDGKFTANEHFGYRDGFGNPDYLGVERDSQPGQGKLTKDGKWVPLAAGELLLGYADEAGELPVAPIPHLLASNGTFMVYRKMHQNVKSFRDYLEVKGREYAGGKEKLASKFIGRWRDGTPVELSPDKPDSSLVQDKSRNVNFTFGQDGNGARCPVGAHIRRTNPRDAFGFNGQLINRRRITRRGMPYGPYIPETQTVDDKDEHGIVFMALNASLFRQFEFVQQQWVEYGNDAHLGNDKDMVIGNHGGKGRYTIQGNGDAMNPPFICSELPNFVELRGGDYFFLPSMTALRMIAAGTVDPR
ncbi:MAG TPA: Dyp-type peroxidase [Candidatus Angelobacter sp.]|nr:Dyp-type peroxidase [Candidatus Angelobacter sp.]